MLRYGKVCILFLSYREDAIMKIGRNYLGKYVEMVWRDPGEARISVSEFGDSPKGKGCLATWKERGILLDITDGIVKIEHSHATGAPLLRQVDESVCTFVPEDLVESLVVFEPVKDSTM